MLLLFIILLSSFSGPGLPVPTTVKRAPPPPVFSTVTNNFRISLPISIDTSLLTAFGAALDAEERLWAAVGVSPGKLILYCSESEGAAWENVLTVAINESIPLIEIVAPPVPGPLFIFYRTAADHGDIYLLRFNPVTLDTQRIPVAVGPDTIDEFTVTVDRDSNYYLYLLFVNEHRSGLNGYFTRSLNKGITWESPQPFWNCFDPYLSFGTGSIIHCIWRYAINGREIHYTANLHYGAPGRWGRLYPIKSGAERCFTLVLGQSTTAPYWRAPVWACWTVARRDTEMLDIEVALSGDGGRSWSGIVNLGEMFVDEWSPALIVTTGGANLCYNAGARGENDPTVLNWRTCPPYAPDLWSSAIRVNAPRVNVWIFGARPRLIPTSHTRPSPPAVFFSCYDPSGARGLYFSRILAPAELNRTGNSVVPHPTIELTGSWYDATGRKVKKLSSDLRSGLYFQHQGTTTKKLLLIR